MGQWGKNCTLRHCVFSPTTNEVSQKRHASAFYPNLLSERIVDENTNNSLAVKFWKFINSENSDSKFGAMMGNYKKAHVIINQ